MIRAIEIENFKSFKHRELIEFKDLSLFSGLNGSGKSSIAQIILLIGQSASFASKIGPINHPYLQLNLTDIELGNANEILNDIRKPLHVAFFYDDSTYISLDFLLESGATDDEFQSPDRYYLNLIKIIIENTEFTPDDDFYLHAERKENGWDIEAKSCISFYDDSLSDYFYKYVENHIGNGKVCEIVKFKSIKDINFVSYAPYIFQIPIESICNCIKKESRKKFSIDQFLKEAEEKKKKLNKTIELNFVGRRILEKYLIQITKSIYIEPFRGKALRIYTSTNRNPLMITKRNNLKKVKYNYDFENNKILETTYQKAFSFWIQKLEIADKVEINEIIDDTVSETFLLKGNKHIAINNDGFGISQILPLIANCLLYKDRLLLIDEPEVHLHPGLQAKIGEFLFIMAKIGKKIIIETHSECIINQIKYLTLCHEEMKENVASYWVEKGPESSEVRKIEYDEYGFVMNPPDGFFDQTAKILKEIRKIRQEKMFNKDNE